MDRWVDIAYSPIPAVKRVKKLLDIFIGLQFKYKDFYIYKGNNIYVNENAEINSVTRTSSIIKQPEGNGTLSAVELELKSLRKDLRISRKYIKILNEVLNEEEKDLAINSYFKRNDKHSKMSKDKYYRIVNNINDKLVLAWRLFYCDENGIIQSYDDIEDMVLKSREILEKITF